MKSPLTFTVSFSDGTTKVYNLTPAFLVIVGLLIAGKFVIGYSWWIVAMPFLVLFGLTGLVFAGILLALFVMIIAGTVNPGSVKWTWKFGKNKG